MAKIEFYFQGIRRIANMTINNQNMNMDQKHDQKNNKRKSSKEAALKWIETRFDQRFEYADPDIGHKGGQFIGPPQGGKSQTMLAYMHRDILVNKRAQVMFVAKSPDVAGILISLRDYNKKLINQVKKCLNENVQPLKMVCVSFLKMKAGEITDKTKNKQIERALTETKEQPPIILCLGSQVQSEKITRLITQERKSPRKISLVFDESHITMCRNFKRENKLQIKEGRVKIPIFQCLEILRDHPTVEMVHGCSATPAANFFSKIFKIQHIFEVKPTSYYRGIGSRAHEFHWIKDALVKGSDTVSETEKKEGWVTPSTDPEFHRVLRRFSEKKIITPQNCDCDLKRSIPNIILIQSAEINTCHSNQEAHILRNHPKVATVVYNSSVTRMSFTASQAGYIRNHRNGKIEIPESNFVSTLNDKNQAEFKKKPVDIARVLQFFANLDENLVSHIAIIGGLKFREGIRINSLDWDFALTDLFIRHKGTLDHGMQKMRILGIRGYRTPTRIWIKKEFLEDLVKAYKQDQDVIESTRLKIMKDGYDMYSSLSEMKFHKAKKPTLKICKVKVPWTEVQTEKEDTFNMKTKEYKQAFAKVKRARKERKEKAKLVTPEKVEEKVKKVVKKAVKKVKEEADRKLKEEKEKEGDLISSPAVDSTLFTLYNKVCDHLNGKGWVKRQTLNTRDLVKNRGRFTDLEKGIQEGVRAVTGLRKRTINGIEWRFDK